MIYISYYRSPIGRFLLAEENNKLIGLWMENQKNYASILKQKTFIEEESPILIKSKKWLDQYFHRENPNIKDLEIHLIGSEFQKNIWEILMKIPYGEVITYGEIAKEMAQKRGIKKISARAVGGAVGHNPISVIIPCHRVIGSNRKLIGYSGGIERKIELLKLEGVNRFSKEERKIL